MSALGAFVLGWWIAVVPPLLGLLGAAALTTGYARQWERGQGRALRQLFEVYVSPDVAGALWAERRSFLDKLRPRPEPRIVTATVLFSDVRGFTRICEAMASEPSITTGVPGYGGVAGAASVAVMPPCSGEVPARG